MMALAKEGPLVLGEVGPVCTWGRGEVALASLQRSLGHWLGELVGERWLKPLPFPSADIFGMFCVCPGSTAHQFRWHASHRE